jgi:DNA-binding IclR family transcriptional regulator
VRHYWRDVHSPAIAHRAKLAIPQDPMQVLCSVEFVREHVYLCNYNLLLDGIGATSCPLTSTGDGTHLAITVSGKAARVERNSAHIISALLRGVRTFSKRPFTDTASLAH